MTFDRVFQHLMIFLFGPMVGLIASKADLAWAGLSLIAATAAAWWWYRMGVNDERERIALMLVDLYGEDWDEKLGELTFSDEDEALLLDEPGEDPDAAGGG